MRGGAGAASCGFSEMLAYNSWWSLSRAITNRERNFTDQSAIENARRYIMTVVHIGKCITAFVSSLANEPGKSFSSFDKRSQMLTKANLFLS